MPDPVIMELAVNGATPRRRNRHVPRDPDEIAEVALAAVQLGASIIHNHNDEPMFTPDGVHAAAGHDPRRSPDPRHRSAGFVTAGEAGRRRPAGTQIEPIWVSGRVMCM